MNGMEDTSHIERYIALDIHKEYVLAGGQNAKQEWVMPPRQIKMAKLREWASANLQAGDAVVIETTTNAWDIYDIVAPLATRTVVAHAGAVRQIAEARVKTDKEDVKRLIRLLIADIVPEVWIPPTEVRELRGMISYRNRLVKMATTPALAVRCKCGAQPPAKSAASSQHSSAERETAGCRLVAGTEDEYIGENADPAGTGDAGRAR
jgi:hypothetical protein